MEIRMDNDLTVLLEAEMVLMKHLGPSKTARFFAAWRQGAGDYLQIREKLFAGGTVDTLYDKILLFQQSKENEPKVNL
ncbi:hypothetical protein FJZ31_30355 [Candidatus Poribacteria bacterium]|nr:hypothetical protein [Candidatus Poribacteria bacterium]